MDFQPTYVFAAEVILPTGSYEEARNEALKLLGQIDPATRVPVVGRFGVQKGKVVGFETVVNGIYKRYRLDYDPVKKAHINIEVGKRSTRTKTAVTFPGEEADVEKILNRLNR